VALGATARVPDMPDTWEGWEDSAVPPERLGDYLRDLSKLYDQFGYSGAALYGHFGQGCVHTRIPFDLVTADGIATFRVSAASGPFRRWWYVLGSNQRRLSRRFYRSSRLRLSRLT
jgi:hypothetical protein